MGKEFWSLTEVVEIFQMDERLLRDLEEEEIVCPTCGQDAKTKVFSGEELEKLRLVKVLMDDMGVNLPGVEVILRMRQDMFRMRNQFDEILEALARDFRDAFER
jgi:MerR family transcriptional regulator/heat shock protein HspR